MDANEFQARLIGFVRELCRAEGVEAPVEPDTPLFDHQLIDSKRMVDLMSFVERELGITIEDSKLSMQYFRSPATITREFCGVPSSAAADAGADVLMRFEAPGARPGRAGVTGMVERGDITGRDDGCVALGGAALALHGYFGRLFAGLGARHGAAPRRYPTLLPLAGLERTDYFKSFPQHATFCACLRHDTGALQHFVSDVKANAPVALAAAARLEAPAAVLSPAVCYHCYLEHAGATLPRGEPVLVTAQGQCFRNERGAFRALDRQYEFTMREIILLGAPAQIEAHRMRLLDEVVAIALDHGFAGTVETATDFFFRDDVDGRARTLHQRANALKYELRVRMDDAGASLAVASFNLHEDYFGRSFGIVLEGGAPASTGCVAFGIERWVSAFLAHHGADLARWPSPVRDACREDTR